MKKSDKILVLGSRGLVGSSIVRELQQRGYENILSPLRGELNLLNQIDVLNYFEQNKPQHVFIAAAKVGGIHANNVYRADFIFQNLSIQNHVFEAAFKANVEKLLFLGSSCIYPKNSPQPIKEEYLLTGPLEPTNEPYAIAKIAGIKTAESFRKQYGCHYTSVMPTNLYGVGDNFHLENSHVIPGLIARMSEAQKRGDNKFVVWGSGRQKRDFLYVDDMAAACVYVMEYNGHVPDLMNIGSGSEITIGELALLIQDALGFQGQIEFDTTKPDGPMRKIVDISRMTDLGWKPRIDLKEGLRRTVEFYKKGVSKS